MQQAQLFRQRYNQGASAWQHAQKVAKQRAEINAAYDDDVISGTCLACSGSGRRWLFFTCEKCGGTGRVDHCQACNGKGKGWIFTCKYCHGSGRARGY
jgi:RecJ-like exonuclease